MITELRYSNTNTYFIRGKRGCLLFDTGWAGTFPKLCAALGENGLKLQDISFVVISHYHPDHMGIAQDIADNGAYIAVADVQKGFIHSSDEILMREPEKEFRPIDERKVWVFSLDMSRKFLKEIGISGELIHTPGHSDDSISLWLEKEKALFVGDLNPLYELEMHAGTQIAESWEKLLRYRPKTVYYGHAPSARIDKSFCRAPEPADTDLYALVRQIMKLIDKGCTAEAIRQKTGADEVFIQDVGRMYLTHQNVGVQGILDRIEIKNK